VPKKRPGRKAVSAAMQRFSMTISYAERYETSKEIRAANVGKVPFIQKANRRKINPRIGPEYSCGFGPEHAGTIEPIFVPGKSIAHFHPTGVDAPPPPPAAGHREIASEAIRHLSDTQGRIPFIAFGDAQLD
jgi:hypothetical protein